MRLKQTQRWKQHLDQYLESLKLVFETNQKKLRFDRSSISASDLAGQFFCEKKVQMEHLYGEVETEAKILGTEAHEKLLEDATRVKREELWRRIYGKDPVLALETFLLTKYKDVVLAGKPDSIMFRNGVPLVVIEHKFSRSQTAYQTYYVQARTYSLMLENMGFDTRLLFYAIVVADPIARQDRTFKKRIITAITNNGPKEAEIQIENARIYLCKYNRTDAERDLDWAIKFWKKEREAIATENPNKCRNCAYFKDCQN